MDLKGSLIDTKLKIYPSPTFLEFIKRINITSEAPVNIVKLAEGKVQKQKKDLESKSSKYSEMYLDTNEIKNIKNIQKYVKNDDELSLKFEQKIKEQNKICKNKMQNSAEAFLKGEDDEVKETKQKSDLNHNEKSDKPTTESDKKSDATKEKLSREYLTTSDIDWLYNYIHNLKHAGEKDIPYLHTLLQDSYIETPENETIKRNPDLEARCVKLRSQQEAREYRKMTRGVDNVRMRFPEDTIAYQLKSMNRQLIAIGQFIISIFAGFLFGFRGVELMVGDLDFGFRLLLGVICALIIALAEIYFLAKKLNEELQLTETVQIGGPPKFADSPIFTSAPEPLEKEHQD